MKNILVALILLITSSRALAMEAGEFIEKATEGGKIEFDGGKRYYIKDTYTFMNEDGKGKKVFAICLVCKGCDHELFLIDESFAGLIRNVEPPGRLECPF
ncbi:hypothetical protein ACFL3E_00395 [Patescibacteria group bacterium]